MKKFNLNDMGKGWFVGNFQPTVYKTDNCEFAIKKYNKGDYEKEHFHKAATEVTVIISGKVKMKGKLFESNDIILIEPNESTDFEVIEDTITAVFKSASVPEDKFAV